MINKIRYSIEYAINRRLLEQAEYFCMFSGYPRSGHSLVGAIMDAHPEMIIAHELNVLGMVQKGYSYHQICAMILSNSRKYARHGREWSNYSYTVPGQWQGKVTNLKVIGDKKGGATNVLLSRDFSLIDKLRDTIPIPLKFIHVVRNPFDNIITRVMQGNDVRKEITSEGVKTQIRKHFEQAATNQRLICEGNCSVLTIKHEDLIANPHHTMTLICNFLGVEAHPDWLEACSAIIFPKPKLTRKLYNYTQEQIDEIMEKMGSFPFFEGYTFFD